MTEAEKRKLLALEMDALRRCCRVSRRQKIRKESIKELIVDNTCDDLQKKQLIRFGHVMQLNKERLSKIVLNLKSTKKRKR